MAAINDPVDPVPQRDELSALSWVQDELRRSLELAVKALRRYLKEQEKLSELDTVDPAVLRQARSQLHQSVGVLELVGLGPAAQVLRAAEAALQRLSARPKLITSAAVDTIERGAFGLLDFIGRRLAGKPVSALALFPQYRALQELAAASRVHPADLWGVDWSWRELAADHGVPPCQADEATIQRVESDLLALMRGAPPSVSARLSEVFAGLAATEQAAAASAPAQAPHGRLATLWLLAAGFYEAQADGLLQPDAYSKRMGSKLLAQLHAGEQGEPSERLAHDLLFFCGQARLHPDGPAGGPRLSAVRRGYGLAAEPPVDYEQARLGHFDPAWVAQARKRVTAAKEVWSSVAGGELARLPGLAEQFALVGDSLARLYPDGALLGRALQVAAAHTVASGAEPPAELAMEVATALLYLDASIDDGDFDHPDGAQRVQRLAQRIDLVRQARDPGTLELWMEELYRRVSDRQTMGSVVQELRAALSEVEKNIDQYFRNPAERELLIPVPAQLQAMRGVLSVLGLDQASQAVLRMRDDVDALASTEVHPQHAIETGTFDRLADNLGALSFLIDMVSVQPQMAKSLFRFDPDTGSLSAVMAREDRPSGFDDLDTRSGEPLVVQPDTDALAVTLEFDRLARQARNRRRGALDGDAASAAAPLAEVAPLGGQGLPMLPPDGGLLDEPTQLLSLEGEDATQRLPLQSNEITQRLPLAADGARLSAPPPAAPPPLVPVSSGLEDDPEMREVFLDEAREVLHSAREALIELQLRHDDLGAMTTVRRAFHTLKGSARMVGLGLFGDGAWACEQLYNARLAENAGADHDLREFTLDACTYFERWVQALAAGQADAYLPQVVSRPADVLRTEHRRLPMVGLGARRMPPLASAPTLERPTERPLEVPAPRPPAALPGSDLRQRVPDLPLASDLDLLPTAQPAVPPDLPALDLPALDLAALDGDAEAATADDPLAVPEATELELPAEFATVFDLPAAPEPVADSDAEAYRQVGPLRISIPLFNIYLNEADELSRRLGVELAEWALEQHRPVGEAAVALAHSLAGSSGTVGYADLSQLARSLEHALERSQARGHGKADESALFSRAADEIRRLLHLFAAGFLNTPDPDLVQRLHEAAHAAPEDMAAEQATRWAEDDADTELDALPAPVPLVEPTSVPPAAPAPVPTPTPAPTPVPARGVDTAPAALASEATTLGRAALLPFTALAEAAPRSQRSGADARTADFDEDIDQLDALDAELLPIFVEEAQELLPQLQARLREWSLHPADPAAASACMRCLHTLKGSARLAGAMRLGEMAHRLESQVEHLAGRPDQAQGVDVEALVAHADALEAAFDALRIGAAAPAPAAPAVRPPAAVRPAAPAKPAPAAPPAAAARGVVAPRPAPMAQTLAQIDWRRFDAAPGQAAELLPALAAGVTAGSVRVRTPLLDRLVNQAGEVSIARSRIESDVGQIKGGLNDLTDNLERLRAQLRDIELQAESQIGTRLEAARAAAQQFDPLEMDRFTRFQELTRMMAESVADVATVQRGLQRTLQSTEDALAHQARMTRDMQDDLLRTRMVEVEGLSERLYRVVRQAAKETGKPVRLDIVGGSIEIDRGVLDRMTPAFEHLLRNSVVHGIEAPALRAAAGKDATGTITLAITQVGNEVGVEVRDDGAGLDLARIRERGLAMGLIAPDTQPADADLANLIFQPGFTTASTLTDLAGRGVGMDVVRTDVNAMGGRIETASAPGQGASFRLVLPLTTAVTQVVMLRCGAHAVAVPSTLIELVRRVPLADLARSYQTGAFGEGAQALPFFWLDALLAGSARGVASGRTAPVVIIRSAAQRVVLHVDEVLGNQEVVVKNLGPQLSRVPGLVGMTLLPSGLPALIYNPVALATLYGDAARQATAAALAQAAQAGGAGASGAAARPLAPLVLVVDDSLTVRRVTQRLLEREGYRVQVAKDGLDGLERLAGELPAVLLTDIEMPRMDGFDLVRNLRVDARLAALPVIMITSRIAQKHRDYAAELGVDHYLGKPYGEEELLSLVARYARRVAQAA